MKKWLNGLIILFVSVPAFAQMPGVTASDFAIQAGTIAGAAQACGVNITEFNSRVNDVVNILGKTPGDRQTAMTAYQQALSKTQYEQVRNHPLNCGQVVNSFQSLPLMRPDFQQTVLPQMASLNNSGAVANSPSSSNLTTNNQSSNYQTPQQPLPSNPNPPSPPPQANNNQIPENSVAVPPGATNNQSPPPGNNMPPPTSVPGNTQVMVTGSGQ